MTRISGIIGKVAALLAALLLLHGGHQAWAAGPETLNMGTGGKGGVYFALGQAMAKRLNPKLAAAGYRIKVLPSQGSCQNIDFLQSGRLALALVQSDAACRAWAGKGRWAKAGPRKNLRSMAALLNEMVTLVCADKAQIKTVADLRGKRVSLGAPGSGVRQNALDALAIYGLTPADLAKAESLSSAQAMALLQKGKLDAMFMTIGHPNKLLRKASRAQNRIRFIAIEPSSFKLRQLDLDYIITAIPANHYPGAVFPLEFMPTIGVRAVLMTNPDLPEAVAQAICQELYGNWVMLSDLHHSLYGMSPHQMLEALCAPLHPAVQKYVKAKGLR